MLPFASPMLMQAAAAGGGGGMGAGPTIHGSNLSSFSSVSTYNLAIPAAAVAGDTLVGFGAQTIHMVNVGSGQGTWTTDASFLDDLNISGMIFHKRLEASDVTRGYVTIVYNNTCNGIAGCVVLPDASTFGSEILTATPAVGGGVTWSAGTATCAGAADIVRWSTVLTVGQTYRCTFNYNKTGGSKLRVVNGATNGSEVIYTSDALANGTGTIDFTFTAVDTYLGVEADSATYSGTLSAISCKAITIHPSIRAATQVHDPSGAASETVTTGSSPVSGDYAIMFGLAKGNVTVTVSSSPGTGLQSLASTPFSGVVRLGTLTGSGAFSEIFNFSGSPAGEYCGIVAFQP